MNLGQAEVEHAYGAVIEQSAHLYQPACRRCRHHRYRGYAVSWRIFAVFAAFGFFVFVSILLRFLFFSFVFGLSFIAPRSPPYFM